MTKIPSLLHERQSKDILQIPNEINRFRAT